MNILKKPLRAILYVNLAICACSCNQEASKMDISTTANTQFRERIYKEVNLGEIQPTGWLNDQLEIMLDHSTGHLDEVYDKIKIDNGWLGGQGDSWEETPYWLDGAVPLAYLLNDQKLKDKVQKYIDWSIENQRPSGYFGPITAWEKETGQQLDVQHCEEGADWWPRMLMLKVIQQYYTATKDKRIIPFMQRYFEYQLETLDKCPIGMWTEWAASRGVENMRVAQWLYGQTGDENLLKLSQKIMDQSFAWSTWLGNRDWVIDAAVHPNGENWMRRHGVNVATAVKEPGINFQRTGDSSYLKIAKTGFKDLMHLHGLPNGIFSADEDLHGNSPIQGTELCAIVETMFSMEELIGISGDPFYMDALERMTFNALPPQTTDDYNEKQYFQMANQIVIDRGVFAFTLPFNHQMNNVLGAKSGYSCCYANMHQGWTKYAQHLWYKTKDDGLAALVYGPNILKNTVNQMPVTIEERTNYPFEDEITFKLSMEQSTKFTMDFRIPVWCNSSTITINGTPIKLNVNQRMVHIERIWKDGDQVVLNFPMKIKMSEWAENSRAVERGPLVYGLKLNEIWDQEYHEQEGKYYTVHTDSSWNYGLLQEQLPELNNLAQLIETPMKENFVWNLQNSPWEIKIQAKQIPDWKAVNGLAYLPVTGREGFYKGEVSETVDTISLVPVGFTKLRIMAFPVVR